MKASRILLTAGMISLFAFIGCRKHKESADNGPSMMLNKSNIAAGESVNISLNNVPGGSLARWVITPSTGVVLDSAYSYQGNTIIFNTPGTYQVKAQMRYVHPNCMPSPGYDTCYTNGASAGRVLGTIQVNN